ncbi:MULTISPECIES: hypothetical protein [Citrobacter]|uniref:Uncharacterized protein n=1 Tax=Citrobacter pasteurii TaxID=1563222 RepID=A0A6N6K4M5_9ENTR|nr:MULTISPECIES: hypothetical protein [Citrobacter]EIQ79982.1 hypothetical protein SF123566_8600 [Shigella flexneri 1235-66]KAA1279018.1 hypothetical protein DXF85_07885 [Citrobacter pasteurii]MBA4712075.1 hypothetical protein [Citrobacter pasteurii]MBD0802640.1 hypothetical protein [Citrobacter sp. C6_1]MBD0811722.1 hypothetical protein [Citrobacter sp. C6_2]
MKIYIIDQNGDLALQNGRSIVVEFADGKSLELAGSPQPLPEGIPDGIHIWGGRIPYQTSEEVKTSQLDFKPVAANGMIVSPLPIKESDFCITGMFIADDDGSLQLLKVSRVVIALDNGKTLEFMEHYANNGLLVWGGREPDLQRPLEEVKQRTESLGLYLLAGNVVHVFPYKVE